MTDPSDDRRRSLRSVSAGGALGAVGRGVFRRTARRRRPWRRRLALFGVGLVVVLLSITTCSAGVDLDSMTAEYGPPVPASGDAARRFIERTATAVKSAPERRRLRIEVTDVEATSVLSLGLMVPELMRAMETMPAEEARSSDDLAVLREKLRAREEARRDSLGLLERVLDVFDPRLRTGDVQVRFTADGEVVAAGYVQAWSWQQPALVVLAPRARDGELELDFRKGRLGRIPAPEWAFDALGGLVSSLILQGREYAEIRELTVREGRMTFVGVAR